MEKRIRLDGKYSLTTDTYNWVLRYEEFSEVLDEKTNEIKTVRSSWESYHGTLQFAINKYCDSVLKRSASVDDLIIKLQELSLKIDRLGNSFRLQNKL